MVYLFYTAAGIGCPVKWLTGISCAGCGMTRAVFCAAQLQFARALRYHPLYPLLPVCAACVIWWEKLPERSRKWLVRMIIACFAGVYIARLLWSDHSVVCVSPADGALWRMARRLLRR